MFRIVKGIKHNIVKVKKLVSCFYCKSKNAYSTWKNEHGNQNILSH